MQIYSDASINVLNILTISSNTMQILHSQKKKEKRKKYLFKRNGNVLECDFSPSY